MEQDVEHGYSTVCSTCLSTDRDLFALSALSQIYEIFRWIMYDFPGESLDTSDFTQLICWECLAMFKKVARFKWQVHNAQEHLRVLAISQETMAHTYMSQSLSTLVIESKQDYDKIFVDYSNDNSENIQYVRVGSGHSIKNEQYEQNVRDAMNLDMDTHIMEVPIEIDNSSTVLSHIVVDASSFIKNETNVAVMPHLTIEPLKVNSSAEIISQPSNSTRRVEKSDAKLGYTVEYMTEADMLATREECKKKVQYASSVYKCELCVIGFYTQHQVEEHFETAHRAKPGLESCKVCYVYVPEANLLAHMDSHYIRYSCKLCARVEYSKRLIALHLDSHMTKTVPNARIQLETIVTRKSQKQKKKKSQPVSDPPKPGDLRKLLSKTTIEGYKCLECDMFFT